MIKSFADRETERLFHGRFARKLPPDIQRSAQRKLRQIHAAGALTDLSVPPGNRLEALKGDRAGQTAYASTISGVSALSGLMAAPSGSKSWTIIDGRRPMPSRDLPPVHPGEQLREEFLAPLGLSAYRLAKDIHGQPHPGHQANDAPSPGIRPCAWRAISARRRNSGSTCNATLTGKGPHRGRRRHRRHGAPAPAPRSGVMALFLTSQDKGRRVWTPKPERTERRALPTMKGRST